MRTPLSPHELVVHFCNQMNLLQDYMKKYDAGEIQYAHEIAVKLRVLFHSNNHSKSLLEQLNLKTKYFLSNSIDYDPQNLAPHHPLVSIRFNGGPNPEPTIPFGSLEPILNPFSNWVHLTPIINWWQGELVIVDSNKSEFTRSRIVREVSDTDGGAHVDPTINDEYFKLSRENSIGWIYHADKSTLFQPINNPVPPTIRAIAEEVVVSLNPNNDFSGVRIVN